MEIDGALILIVDDSATMRLIISDALKKGGFEVLLAHDGEQALSLFKKYQA